ncbi:MAG: cation:proton antiporter, partial [Bacteroidales bacterium]|nr:cation:proton antiporter [Bacteroidales bacterium]
MTFIAGNYLLVASILIFAAILISKIGPKVGVPTLMIFLLVGMLFGSDGLGIQFDNINHVQFIGMVALSVILFSGGMDTRLDEIRPVLKQGITLSTLGVALTALLTGTFIYLITRSNAISFAGCLLLGATISSTDSASVFGILRDQKMGLKHNAQPLLELESGSNDPMAYMLT